MGISVEDYGCGVEGCGGGGGVGPVELCEEGEVG
jgi:hypothetical protein